VYPSNIFALGAVPFTRVVLSTGHCAPLHHVQRVHRALLCASVERISTGLHARGRGHEVGPDGTTVYHRARYGVWQVQFLYAEGLARDEGEKIWSSFALLAAVASRRGWDVGIHRRLDCRSIFWAIFAGLYDRFIFCLPASADVFKVSISGANTFVSYSFTCSIRPEIESFWQQTLLYVMTDFTESNFKFWAEHPVSKLSSWFCSNTAFVGEPCPGSYIVLGTIDPLTLFCRYQAETVVPPLFLCAHHRLVVTTLGRCLPFAACPGGGGKLRHIGTLAPVDTTDCANRRVACS